MRQILYISTARKHLTPNDVGDILRSRRLVTTLLESNYTDEKGRSVKLIDHVMGGTPSVRRRGVDFMGLGERGWALLGHVRGHGG